MPTRQYLHLIYISRLKKPVYPVQLRNTFHLLRQKNCNPPQLFSRFFPTNCNFLSKFVRWSLKLATDLITELQTHFLLIYSHLK